MPDPTAASTRGHTAHPASAGGGNTVYALGLIGALIYFWKQADSVRGYALATLKALVWPAFLVYDAFQHLGSRPNYDDGSAMIDNQ